MRRLWIALSTAAFALGMGALALTAWLWLGDWPSRTKELIDHYRSVARNTARPPEPLIGNARARDVVSLAGSWPAVIRTSSRSTDSSPLTGSW